MIAVFHLLNDYSGSPKVLKMVLEDFLNDGVQVDLHTSRGGVLDELADRPGMRIHHFSYRFGGAATPLRFLRAQCCMFFGAFRYLFKKNYFYINTLLPVGAAIAGRLMGKRVVYHYHENADAKGALYKLLSACMQHIATEIICVSEYQRSFLKRQKGVRVVPNRVPADFLAKLQPNPEAAFERKRVLMVGSLKEYKGTKEFVELARRLPDYRFELVLNADPEEVQAQFGDGNRGNLTVWGRQADVSTFYNRASLLLNLSNKELFIETFGLTAVEGMSAGLPVIVPTVGGIAEMVSDGENGYKIDVQDLDKVEEAIRRLLTDRTLYLRMAENALRSSDEINHRKCT